METQAQLPTMSVNGWLPNGVKVYFNFNVNTTQAFEDAMAITNALLEKGFSQTEPGLESGEHRESINVVSRRNQKNSDGTVTPVLDLYVANDKMKHRFLAVYLDTEDDVKAFEAASGVKLSSVPTNPTSAPVDRDVEQFTLKTKPFNMVYKNNPQYDENNDAKKPKRLFVRWDGVNAPQYQNAQENAEKGASGAKTGNFDVNEWDKQAAEIFVHDFEGKLTTDQLLTALNVKKFGEWTQGRKAAYEVANAAVKLAQVAF